MPNRVDTDIFCPHCAERIDLNAMRCPKRVLLAIALQAERYGTEICCRHCGVGFVYTRIRPQAGQRRLHTHVSPATTRSGRHRPHANQHAKPA